ncbi:MAG: glycosyltransferase family 4 protein [Saprospiraceae bacterium]|nr:glycosyltransferase family 4 protein [Saprospiraceae bacterium]
MRSTTISSQVQKEIIELTGCPEDKVKVVPIALSAVFKPRTFKPFSSTPRILMIGSAPNKNILRCLEALQDIPCEIHMVAQKEDQYMKLLEQSGHPYYYESGLNQVQMSAKYREMDILLFASTYEGFGMPIIEAQAMGLPVVTSNISSMPEVAGEAAQLVDPFDVLDIRRGILKLIGDPTYRAGLVNKGFENIKRFNPVMIAQQYAAIYHQLTS